MKDIRINFLGTIKGTNDKIIVESGAIDYFVYIMDENNNKQVAKYYTDLGQLIEEFEYDVNWEEGEMTCPICGKTNFQEEHEVCQFCGWINEFLVFDNPCHTPKNKLSVDEYKEMYNQRKLKNLNYIWKIED